MPYAFDKNEMPNVMEGVRMHRAMSSCVMAVGFIGCSSTTVVVPVETPTNLVYELEASGDPSRPAGLLLRWDGVTQENLSVYRVYSSADPSGGFGLRGETTSLTFHDVGQPDLEYFVTAVNLDGFEGPASISVVVDERLRLDDPSWLQGTSLDGAVHLLWNDNAFAAAPAGFKQYRLYSAAYSYNSNDCGAWVLEGTTVAPEFLSSALPNGISRCFGVSAESIEGWESLWSPVWLDTPRPDARNIVVFATDVDINQSGFRFHDDANGDGIAQSGELGIVTSGNRSDVDFRMTRDVNQQFFIEPVRGGTLVRSYMSSPVPDLTSIDLAPEGGYTRLALQALPQFGYVFEMDGGDQFLRYGGLRLTHVGKDYVIFDWSYQTDPGNPELVAPRGSQ